MYRNELPFRVEHQRLVKDVMIVMIVEAGRDWILRAKTGRQPAVALILRILSIVGAVVTLSFTAACGTLETGVKPGQPSGESAVLEGYWRYLLLYDEELGISAVDGKRATGILGHVRQVRLPLGEHWIELQIDRNSALVARCAFGLDFSAGHHYRIRKLKVEGLLAHPVSSPREGTIVMAIEAPGGKAEELNVAVACTAGELLCRQDSDCPPDRFCQAGSSYDAGICNTRDR